jgi:SAM-dependent methyltransferase
MTLSEGWREQAVAWAHWARTPGHDSFFWRFNLPRFFEIVPDPGRLTIEVGCGEGRMCRELRARGHTVIGVDQSDFLIQLAADDRSTAVVLGDGGALPVRDAVADLVVAFMVLQDVDDLDAVIGECARVACRGGRLCLAIVHPLASAGDFVDEESPDSPFVITRGYSQTTRLVEPLERDGMTMVFHSEHRPLSAYAAALERAGFVIESLREPLPADDVLRDHPRLRRQQRVPWFLHLRARLDA